ncbi:MAG: diaminopimelate epimerase [Chloracidobacterium sp.]
MLVLHKLHGLGNDFLIFDGHQPGASIMFDDPQRHAPAVCDRHCGVGADGVIAVKKTDADAADYSMTLWNADGSRAEMSGNGLRCVAAFVRRVMGWESDTLRVLTEAGIRTVTFLASAGQETTCAIRMGKPIFTPEQIPMCLDASRQPPLVNVALALGDEVVTATVLSMGNPHCTVFVEDVQAVPLAQLGPRLERHPAFPQRTNVEFAAVRDRHNLDVVFWERGVGRTAASGTGACAAAVAAMLNGLVERTVTIHAERGTLTVTWDAVTDEVILTGSAHYVARVDWTGGEPET